MGQYKFKINGKDYEVKVNSIQGTNADVTVNGVNYCVELEGGAPASSPKVAAPSPVAAPATSAKAAPQVAASKASAAVPAAPGAGNTIKSPLPGVILDVCVKEGQAVKRGQKLIVLEAMKMENEIQAESDGTVSAILVQKGDSVLEGAALVTFE